jgi:hypothetical protein
MVKRRLWAGLICVHGVIHLLGFQAALGIASREEFSAVPAFPSVAAGSVAVHLLGSLWLLAAALFLVTATLLLHGSPGWRPAAAAASVVSLGVCILWWHDAPVGAAVDLAILAGLATSQISQPRPAHPLPVLHRPAAVTRGG